MTMLTIKPFTASIETHAGGDKYVDQSCEVVGVHFDGADYQLVVIVKTDGAAYAKAVEIVDLPAPTGHVFGD